MVRRVALGTNLTHSSQTLHVRGQRHGMFTTNGSEREKSNPLTAGGLLKILRDSHSRPYLMVQRIEDNFSPTPHAKVKRMIVGGLLKILRDSHSRPDPMVQGKEVKCLANPIMLGVNKQD